MKNPFHLKALPLSVPFCDREKEMNDLMRYAGNSTNVVLSSPRRYGKTSLIKRVQDNLAKHGALTIYIDYFGISSIDEFSARFAGAVYSVVYKEKSLFEKAAKVFASLRPIMRPDPETGMAFTVEAAKSKPGGQLLEETLKGFGEFLKSGKISCNVAFDEFQEITELKESKFIEGTLRSYMQDQQNVSYFFVGSRRRILMDMFNDKKRPFYKSAINYVLPALPAEDTAKYLSGLFGKNGKNCPLHVAARIHALTEGYPYYIQKLSYFIFEASKGSVTEASLHDGFRQMLIEETPLFELMLQALRPRQIALLHAIAKEATKAPFAAAYLTRHRLGSLGGVQAAIKKLPEMDYLERTPAGWKVVDPIFAHWLRQKEVME
ncbi:MAG: ATP-binding protein [Elusimicrobia bacterium]|nr:ATP-binding protein [Elusimicrobiota bacterium]